MKNYLLLLIGLSFMLSGCRTTFKQGWNNFNAYYNTFYNAKESYETGLRKNLEQPREYNPLIPIRIHKIPVNAGSSDFEKAIEKSADILRNYDDSKWVDDAILIIGKSYYFRREYFSADQKFRELYNATENNDLKQISVIWQARVQLDMEAFSSGISLLNDELLNEDLQWNDENRAEAQAMLAQLYVEIQNWQLAEDALKLSLKDLPHKELKERGYFLLGQVNEALDDLEDALEAYDNVSKYYTEYQVQYLAKRKSADIARSLGRTDLAYDIFDSMIKDDKNTEFQAELRYELAKTEQSRGNPDIAKSMYRDIMRNELLQPDAETKAKVYYGLAEIYRFNDNNFQMAAAYYDSSSQQNVPEERLPDEYRASELSESFGEYSRIKNEIADKDSLLRLGRMSPEEFEEELEKIRAQRIAELEELKRKQEEARNTLINVDTQGSRQNTGNNFQRNGFLNVNNQSLLADNRQQFKAIWGNRPLVDNWRVASILQSAAVDEGNNEIDESEVLNNENGSELIQIEIDTSNIPFEESEQDSVENIISEYYYNLGNLFFLSLGMTDSARVYYEKVLERPAGDQIRALALYSLSELEDIYGDRQEARALAEELTSAYPKTEYARRLALKYNLERDLSSDSVEVDPKVLYLSIENELYGDKLEKADTLISFAREFPGNSVAANAMFEGINLYISDAKNDSLYQSNISKWDSLNTFWSEQVRVFENMQDSIRATLKDTSVALSEEQQIQMEQSIDSTLVKPDFSEAFPYRGQNWDSVRVYLDEFKVLFGKSPLLKRIATLESMISIPEKEREEKGQEKADANTNVEDEDAEKADSEYLSCSELDAKPSLRTEIEPIIQAISWPDSVAAPDSLRFEFWVNTRGVVDSLKLENVQDSLSFKTEIETVVRENVNFEPVLNQGQAAKFRCRYSFLIEEQN